MNILKYAKHIPSFPNSAGIILLSLLLIACHPETNSHKIKIGLSQCVGSDKWRRSMLKDLQRELIFYPNVSLVYKDADNNNDLQIRQIDELVKEDIDLLIVSPNEARPLTPVVEDLYNRGLPVIVIDRKIASSLYTAYIGADNYEVGKRVGEYTANLLHGKGKIIEIMGLAGSSPAIERDRGFSDALRAFPQIKIATRVYADWLKEKVAPALEKVQKKTLSEADLVFAHNDMMALGAREFFGTEARSGKPYFIGVDGLPGPGAGLEFVTRHILNSTALYPTGGDEAIRRAMAILNHQPYTKENILQTVMIDSTNVRLMVLQADKINSQQDDIERQQRKIYEQTKIYRSQRSALAVILIMLIAALLLGAVTFYYLRENKKINHRLEQKHAEVIRQQEQLVRVSAEAQAANDAKLKFFTNISHEFRTPLTLILAPLEELLSNTKINASVKQPLLLVQKNVIRLLRLVNQLMDFRKVELNKLRLKATQNNLVAFVEEIMDAFRPLVTRRSIDFRLTTRERDIPLWFDINMLDKVIFNLLSNAFKFTNDNGFIHISIYPSADDAILITVEDNGIGMLPEAVDHAFEAFYSNEITSKQGAGLGLALSKELITLHQGTITVKSTKWQGTRFEITLPRGTAHLSEGEIITGMPSSITTYEDEKIFIAELEQAQYPTYADDRSGDNDKSRSVLVVEDNQDMRNFLHHQLNPDYEVLEADNGINALQQAFDNIPDLIICDIVIPGKDGISITNTLKNDIRTSHIPVILLTARTTIEQQIEGMRNMADAYIMKPFNFPFLKETINSVMKNRELLREHYTSELPVDSKSLAPKKLDRKFINEFTAIIESNLANDKFGVEDIYKTIGVSRVQLYRKVKALLGCNVNDYILTARVQKAKYLLNERDLSISEIAFKVGFSSAAYFSTVFKSKMNMTPKEYREKKQ